VLFHREDEIIDGRLLYSWNSERIWTIPYTLFVIANRPGAGQSHKNFIFN
jgi:hypothetical protein